MNAFILATSVAWANPQPVIYDNPGREATKAVAKIMYIESGLNKKVEEWEKRYIPKKLKKYAVWPTLVIKVATEKRISYEWTF